MNHLGLRYFIIWIGFIFIFSSQLYAQDHEIIAINKTIEKNDCEKLSNYFQASISLSVQNSQGNYSKIQARYILADFFEKNPVIKTTKINTDKMTNNSFFCILQYETSNKTFNICYTIQKKEKSYLINEIQIKEKSK